MRSLRLRPFPPSLVLMGACVLLCACSSIGSRKGSARPQAANLNPTYLAPAHQSLGRIAFFDPVGAVAVMEFTPWVTPPADLAGRALIARHPDTLAPTANLTASTRRSGPTLGLYVTDGVPQPGDEVVLRPLP